MRPRPKNEKAEGLYQTLGARMEIYDLALSRALESSGLKLPDTLEELFSSPVDPDN